MPEQQRNLGFSDGSVVENLPAKSGEWVQSLGQDDLLEKEMATHSSIFAWEILWTGAWQASVHGVAKESDMTWQLNSIDLIFRGRQADFYTTKNSEDSVATAKKLLQENNYDLIVCYDGNYDSTMHANGVFAEKSIAAMKDSIRYYTELVEVADQTWADKNYVSVFCPDHGAHDAKAGKGTHGSAQASDAIVNHFYRLRYVNK